jgi:uncharacterized protein (TIGR02722 family)
MKKSLVVVFFIVCILMAACSSGPKVSRVAADTQTDLSGRWNDSDVRQVCETLINSAVNSQRIDTFIKEFSAKNRGALPTIIVGNFRNTSSEHIDTRLIANLMRTAIINSGKLEFVASGTERDQIRSEREDQQSNASERTASSLMNETGADFMLTGVVNSMEEKAGNMTVRSYFVKATLTNIESNRIWWEDDNNDIKKEIKQARAKF